LQRLAQIYLQDKWVLGDKRGRLGLLLKKLGGEASPFSQLQMPGLCFALIENLDFWLMEKAFSIVEQESGKQQITLYNQVETRRRRLHGETSRWLWQRERMYSFSRKSDEAK